MFRVSSDGFGAQRFELRLGLYRTEAIRLVFKVCGGAGGGGLEF